MSKWFIAIMSVRSSGMTSVGLSSGDGIDLVALFVAVPGAIVAVLIIGVMVLKCRNRNTSGKKHVLIQEELD
ncbi:hypothetical protein K469DRAFT_24364 [Zopfia rhizophila CBS 207.26]|uniref:Uncharacterized protein n=1 Tax=Zopfia rhizophila CBS 207.26 TaxID=1314779 RepID=A0A6A6EGD2_9PEZI|nr:hypothetical protein K469DRAFT_24364 [Zopfia rhizophila CBS 207.26]